MNERLMGMIGFAIKAGKAVSGTYAVEGALRRGKARLVIVDGRASQNTIQKFETMCRGNGADHVLLKDTGMLELLLGRDNRTVMAITDGGFADAIQEILKKE
jgi:ribosomal protein L7Ae-like RNA K-turn-binding protein